MKFRLALLTVFHAFAVVQQAQMSHSIQSKRSMPRSVRVPFAYEQAHYDGFELQSEMGLAFDSARPSVFVTAAGQQLRKDPARDFSEIRKELRDHTAKDDVPGMAVAVSQGGRIIWEEGFGWADREKHLPAAPNTPFYIASVTKAACIGQQERVRT